MTEEAITYDVVVAGHICIDLIPKIYDAMFEFEPGTLVETGSLRVAAGGAVSNIGLAMHKLGNRIRLIGKVGCDLLARFIGEVFESHGNGLSDHLSIAAGEQTSYSIVLSPPSADRMFLHHPGCNATFDQNDVDYDLVGLARLFHFGYPPLMAAMIENNGDALATMFRMAKTSGATTSLDMSLPDKNGPSGRVDWIELLRKSLPWVDVFVPNVEELLMMTRPGEYERLSLIAGAGDIVDYVTPKLLTSLGDELLSMETVVTIIKIGHRGIYLRTANKEHFSGAGQGAPADIDAWSDRELWAPCFLVDVAGLTGSGDATVAGLLTGILRGLGPEMCMTAGNAVGACSAEAADSVSGIRSWDETLARVERGWPRLPLTVDTKGWTWDEQNFVWAGPNDRAASLSE